MATKITTLLIFSFSLVLAGTLWAAGSSSYSDYGGSDTLGKAQEAIAGENYPRAIKYLKKAEKQDRNDADVQNLLGYSYRKLGDYDRSKTHYERALALNPDHLGAHEYMGELYLQLNRPDEAKKLLGRLKALCGDCEEFRELAEAIDSYQKSH